LYYYTKAKRKDSVYKGKENHGSKNKNREVDNKEIEVEMM